MRCKTVGRVFCNLAKNSNECMCKLELFYFLFCSGSGFCCLLCVAAANVVPHCDCVKISLKFFSHKQFRRLLKKERRRQKRQEAAKQREQKELEGTL